MEMYAKMHEELLKKNCVGKTLLEIHLEYGIDFSGYSIFVLKDENDETGEQIDENISIGIILRKHPEYAAYKVKYVNDFFGMTVFRVIKELTINENESNVS